MRRSVSFVSVVVLILFFASGQAYSATHRHKCASTRKRSLTKHHSSAHMVTATEGFGTEPAETCLVAEDEPIRLKASGRGTLAKIPRRPGAVSEQAATVSESDGEGYVEYRVKRGDTLKKLAQRFHIDKEKIADPNEGMTTRLTPGSVVFIPKAQEAREEAPIVLNDRPLKPWKDEEERGILVKVAKSFAGAPYRYGGENVRGLDCSAFVRKIYEIFEVELPRCAREQYYAGPRVDRNDLKTGDLVFFKTMRCASYPTHVGIYIGDDEFIHASSLLRRGVKIDRLSDAYFTKTYMGAVRVKAVPAKQPDPS